MPKTAKFTLIKNRDWQNIFYKNAWNTMSVNHLQEPSEWFDSLDSIPMQRMSYRMKRFTEKVSKAIELL